MFVSLVLMNVLMHGVQPGTRATMQQMVEWGVMQERTGRAEFEEPTPPGFPGLTQTAILASHCLRKDPLVHAPSVRRQAYAGLAPNLHKLTAQQACFRLRRSRESRFYQGFAGVGGYCAAATCGSDCALGKDARKKFSVRNEGGQVKYLAKQAA
ncbi:hypothetical protein [Herbaspirillum rubrisubalbicans]|uniref:hypothetical protein n=1 Tax=Herbaspirillum rubrisubalbicans TaxID=80842 RepID=UPI001ABF19A1|nr:hypothetical protein [Herbaspirillum rubrisubalbicans]